MTTELDIIDSLTAVAYKGKCLQNDVLGSALAGGTRSPEFRDVVAWLAHELHVLRKTDEQVSSDVGDPNEFAMELSSFLKELGCPYKAFVAGPLSERFESFEGRIQLLDYLLSELMAIKMSLRLKPVEDTSYVISKTETNTARAMQQLSQDLGLGKPPENIAPRAFFDKLNFKVEERMRSLKPGVLSEPLLRTSGPLTEEQWDKLEKMHLDLDAEYNLRRQVLLTRLEVTLQSFQWSESMKSRNNDIVSHYQPKMQELEPLKRGGDSTNIVALLAAREDLAIIEKTSSANVRKNTGCKIQKHVIGSVPDRGGRAHEHAPPPPEMPSWQQQRASGPGSRGGGGGGNFRGGFAGGRGGRGGGGGGGGGNWQQSQQQQQQHQVHYQQQQQPQYQQQQQQQFEQRGQYEKGRDSNWVHGSGRVQGAGWTQKNNGVDVDRGFEHGNSQTDYHRGRGGRGRSNYNRGGGGNGGGYRR